MGDAPSVSLAEDDRARIPFALIGVMVLLSSVFVVTTLETRPDPEVDISPSVAVDRAAAASQGELREAVVRASERAAMQPVTQAADTPFGHVLAAGDPETASRSTVFTRYVKLLVYRQTRQRLAGVRHHVASDTWATLSLAPVENASDAADAVEAVTLHVGGENLTYGDTYEGNLAYGKVRATVEGVDVTVVQNGQRAASETRAVTTTVGTPVFQLYELTREYERQLNTDFSEASGYAGLGKFLSGRLVPLSYTRGYAQNRGEPVREVLTGRHVEVSANDAIFALQRHVFGHQDRQANATLTRGYACMLAADQHRIYDDPIGNGASVRALADRLDDSFCNGTTNDYASVTADLSDRPKWRDLMNETAFLDQSVTLDLDENAEFGRGEGAVEDAVQNAIDRVYMVEVRAETDVETSASSSGPSDRLLDRSVTIQSIRRVIDRSSTARTRTYYRIDLLFDGLYAGSNGRGRYVRYDLTLRVKGEHSTDARAKPRGIEHDYRVGPVGDDDTMSGTNYVAVPEKALEEAVAGVDNASRAKTELREHVLEATSNGDDVDAESVNSADELVDIVVADGEKRVEVAPDRPDELRGWLAADLARLEESLSKVESTVRRRELIAGESPYEDLKHEISDEKQYVYPYVEGTYENVPDKARAEARLALVERMRTRLNRLADRHDEVKTELDTKLGRASLYEVVNFTQRQLGPSPRKVSRADLPDRELLEGMTVVADGEPTYLTRQQVSHAEVPAVDDSTAGFAPLASAEGSNYSWPERRHGLRAVELATAGKVLDAGKAAQQVTSDTGLDSSVAALEADVSTELDSIAYETSEEAARPFSGLTAANLYPVVHAEISDLGPVETRAIRLGTNASVRRQIAEDVAAEFSPDRAPEYDYFEWQFEAHLASTVEFGLEQSLERTDVTEPPLGPTTASVAESVRRTLVEADGGVSEARFEQAATTAFGSTNLTGPGEKWLFNDLAADELSPSRVPAGRAVVAELDWHHLTANVWRVRLEGEYRRFVLQSSAGSPATTSATQLVRQAGNVSIEVGERDVSLGQTEKVAFETSAPVLVAVPDEGISVGDRTNVTVATSLTYPRVGPTNGTATTDDDARSGS